MWWQCGTCALHAGYLRLQTHIQGMYHLLLFHYNNCCPKAPQYDVNTYEYIASLIFTLRSLLENAGSEFYNIHFVINTIRKLEGTSRIRNCSMNTYKSVCWTSFAVGSVTFWRNMMDSKMNAIHGLKLNVAQIIQQPERTSTQIFFIRRSTLDLVPKTRQRWFFL